MTLALLTYLGGDGPAPSPGHVPDRVWEDDDAQLALYLCYELHYRGLRGVPDTMEWDPAVLALRQRLEDRFVAELRAAVDGTDVRPRDAEAALRGLAGPSGGPSMSDFMSTRGTLEQFREFCVHRSAYQLKEADPHTWCLPRLSGAAKAAMVEIQMDEYGEGQPGQMHAELFADTMRLVGLDNTYGTYLDVLPAVTLATVNLVSLFGLHRRWRGALVGHLALFEMTSVGPMSRYAAALDRLGVNPAARRFYDVHVAVDEHHERIALEAMVRGLLATEPDLAGDVVFGAAALSAVESRFSAHLFNSWAAGQSSLRDDLAEARAVVA